MMAAASEKGGKERNAKEEEEVVGEEKDDDEEDAVAEWTPVENVEGREEEEGVERRRVAITKTAPTGFPVESRGAKKQPIRFPAESRGVKTQPPPTNREAKTRGIKTQTWSTNEMENREVGEVGEVEAWKSRFEDAVKVKER